MSNPDQELIAVVMAGGRGTRFWPRSRTSRPKQFLAMVGQETLLHQTVNRLKPRFLDANIYIATTRTIFGGTSNVHTQLAVVHRFAIEEANRSFGLGLGAHRDEGKALRLARIAVLDQGHVGYSPGLGKQRSQIFLSGVVGQVAYIQFHFHLSSF